MNKFKINDTVKTVFLKEFLKSRDKSIYDFSHYMELQDKIENHILFNKESLKNLIEVKSIKTA